MTPSESSFLAAARALCKKTKPHPYWPSDGEYREALPRALSLIDSQTALLAARDAEIAGLRGLLREGVTLLEVSDLSAENQHETVENGAYTSYDARRERFFVHATAQLRTKP